MKKHTRIIRFVLTGIAALFLTVPLHAQEKPDARVIYIVPEISWKKELGTRIDSVVVFLVHRHDDLTESKGRIPITPTVLNETESLEWQYQHRSDTTRSGKLKFSYGLNYYLKAGRILSPGWKEQESNVVFVPVPYESWQLTVWYDSSLLGDKTIKELNIQIQNPFFGDTLSHGLRYKPGQDKDEVILEMYTEIDKGSEFKYIIEWVKSNGTRITQEGQTREPVLLVGKPGSSK